MAKRRRPEKLPRPCGSGKKYKACCWAKGFEWLTDERGQTYRSVPLTPDAAAVIEHQRQRFVAEHGRNWGPDDLVFPGLPHPEHLEAMMVEDMKRAGLDPAFIHAFEATGRLVTQRNRHLIPDADLAAWDVGPWRNTAARWRG